MEPIKLSVPDWCFYGRCGGDGYYAALRDMGIDAVEMVDPSRYDAARAAGLRILNMSGPGMTRGLNRREHHAEILPAIRDAVAHAAAHNIPMVIIFSGNRGGGSTQEGIDNCRRGIEALMPDAQRAGVVLAFEMLCSHDHKDYDGDRSAYGFALADAIRMPWFQLIYDIYHMSKMGDDVLADLRFPMIEHVAHIHVAESPKRDAPLADGTINHRRIVPAVRKAGYDGYWGLEFLPGADPLAELRQSVQMLRSL